MLAAGLVLLTAVGLGAALTLWGCQRAVLRSDPPSGPRHLPPVTILKPLRGLDDGLEENLRSFFRLDYPKYEIVFAAADAADPALEVARRISEEFPHVPSTIVADVSTVGVNPKVNNLANAARRARHGIFLISDSNVRAGPGHLAEVVGHLEQPGVGLVSSTFRATGERGLGGFLERLQLNTFVMGGVCAMRRLTTLPCVVGKSMLLRRADLERIGGFEFLGAFLAEDQVCGEEIRALGRIVEVSGRPVDTLLGRKSLREFAARHLRWARLRRNISPAGYVGEALLNPIPFGVAAFAVDPRAATLALALGSIAMMSILAATAERRIGVRRKLASYPALELLRGCLVAALWPIPFVSRNVTWRGNRLRVGPRSRLVPVNIPARPPSPSGAHPRPAPVLHRADS